MDRRAAAMTILVAILAGSCGWPSTAAGPGAGEGTSHTWVLAEPDEVHVPPPSAKSDGDGQVWPASELNEADVFAPDDPVAAFSPWVELALDFVANRTKDPPAATRAYALLAVAIHDTVIASFHWQHEYQAERPDGDDSSPYPSTHAAIAGAASEVLAFLFPEQPEARLRQMAEDVAAAEIAAGTSRSVDTEAGLALGREIAKLVIDRREAGVVVERATDAHPTDVEQPSGPEHWAPPPGSVARPASPDAGGWEPWLMSSGDQFRPGPPPDFHSTEFRSEAQEVIDVKDDLTAEQRRAAEYWEGGEGTSLPPGIWNEVALAFLAAEDMTLLEAVQAVALLNVAMDDASVAAWDAKYAYWSPRPENAIRDLGLDPDWTPYLETPLFPAYVSGHATYSGAAQVVMSHLFPQATELFEERALEATDSRLYGGIHFRSDNEVGYRMGLRIGELAVEHALNEEDER